MTIVEMVTDIGKRLLRLLVSTRGLACHGGKLADAGV
jgi:hypothetical protein